MPHIAITLPAVVVVVSPSTRFCRPALEGSGCGGQDRHHVVALQKPPFGVIADAVWFLSALGIFGGGGSACLLPLCRRCTARPGRHCWHSGLGCLPIRWWYCADPDYRVFRRKVRYGHRRCIHSKTSQIPLIGPGDGRRIELVSIRLDWS